MASRSTSSNGRVELQPRRVPWLVEASGFGDSLPADRALRGPPLQAGPVKADVTADHLDRAKGRVTSRGKLAPLGPDAVRPGHAVYRDTDAELQILIRERRE